MRLPVWFLKTMASAVVLIATALVIASVAPSQDATPQRVEEPGQLEWEVRERPIERMIPVGRHVQPLAFRSGGAVTTLLTDHPLATYQIMYDVPGHPTGGLAAANRNPIGDMVGLGTPSDVVGVTSDGISLYLDRTTGSVRSQTVSIRRSLVTVLDSVDRVQSACMLGSRTIAFVTARRQDSVFYRDVDGDGAPRALSFPASYLDSTGARWSDLRFGGSDNAPCVLWAPRMRTVVLVSDSALRPLGRLVSSSAGERWPQRLWDLLRRHRPADVLDATTIPGAVAILAAGRSDDAGRIVDFYGDDGRYLETLVLPRPSLRIAGNYARLFVLSEHRDSVLFASYVLPRDIRPRIPADSARAVDAHVPAEWLRRLRASNGSDRASAKGAQARRSAPLSNTVAHKEGDRP